MPNSKLKKNKSKILNKILEPNKTIGIFGGGQLGRMTCFAAHKLGFRTIIFSDEKNSPASFVTSETIVADYEDEEALKVFANKIDIATLEFENIPTNAIDFVSSIKPVYPGSKVLKITQDRLNEKDFLRKNKIAVTDYSKVSNIQKLKSDLQKFGGKAILKTATMGYDGKGQFVLDKKSDLKKIWEETSDREMILEKFADFEQEISVVVARSVNGEILCYDPLTNIHKNGILNRSIYPAKITKKIAKNAVDIATKIAKTLDVIGLITVEFFVLKDGKLLVNELAPRPHNSGHFSMDACVTSQFEQLIRAVAGMKLGSVKFHSKGYMQNLIGKDVLDVEKYLRNPRAKVHLYGKMEVKAGRKMGHVNILS